MILSEKVLKKLEESIQLGASFKDDWSFLFEKIGGDESILTSIFWVPFDVVEAKEGMTDHVRYTDHVWDVVWG